MFRVSGQIDRVPWFGHRGRVISAMESTGEQEFGICWVVCGRGRNSHRRGVRLLEDAGPATGDVQDPGLVWAVGFGTYETGRSCRLVGKWLRRFGDSKCYRLSQGGVCDFAGHVKCLAEAKGFLRRMGQICKVDRCL